MRPLAIAGLLGLSLAASLMVLRRLDEERSARALAGHLGCSMETSRRLLRLARLDGYGSAYRQVFADGAIQPSTASTVESGPTAR